MISSNSYVDNREILNRSFSTSSLEGNRTPEFLFLFRYASRGSSPDDDAEGGEVEVEDVVLSQVSSAKATPGLQLSFVVSVSVSVPVVADAVVVVGATAAAVFEESVPVAVSVVVVSAAAVLFVASVVMLAIVWLCLQSDNTVFSSFVVVVRRQYCVLVW